jgi:hypothetical protein
MLEHSKGREQATTHWCAASRYGPHSLVNSTAGAEERKSRSEVMQQTHIETAEYWRSIHSPHHEKTHRLSKGDASPRTGSCSG